MGEAAAHEFRQAQASPVLIAAMRDLAERTGRTLEDFEGTTLGDAFELAQATWDTLPEFWKVWSDWNNLPDEPRPMGDL